MTSQATATDPHRLVDDELRPMLERFPTGRFSPETLQATRAAMAELGAAFPAGSDPRVTEAEHWAPGPAGAPDVRCRIFRPAGVEGPLPTIFHIHGGGYVVGSPEITAPRARNRCAELQCMIVSTSYRLAPETAAPGSVEDCYASLIWLYRNAAKLGADPTRIAVAGESAGGGLAAALCLVVRDRGEVPVILQHLTYPMLDDRTCVTDDPHPHTGAFVWTAEDNRFGWSALLGQAPGSPDVHAYAAPARAADLSGLPPTYISVGALDLFLEEDLEYARRLARAGVPVELHLYPGAFHGFELSEEAKVAIASHRDAEAAFRRAFEKAQG